MIHIDTLSKTFSGGKGLDRVSLHIKPGEMVALIGSSGSGKSTLMRHIAGLMPGDADGGRIEVAQHLIQDRGVISRDIRTMRAEIGMVFQHFNLLMQRTVLGNVCFPLEIVGMSRKDAKKRAMEVLKLVGIADKANAYPSQLSGGQKQRALLARALCAADKMLLLDEPVSGLDPKVSARMYDLIDSLNKDDGVTVIMISHDISAAVQYARHILHLGSRDVFFGSVEEYRESPLGMSFISGAGK